MNKTQTQKTTKTKTVEDAKVSLDKRKPLMEAAHARKFRMALQATKFDEDAGFFRSFIFNVLPRAFRGAVVQTHSIAY